MNINSCFMSQGRGGVQPRATQASCKASEKGHVVGTMDSTELGYRNHTLANICTVLHALYNVATTMDHLGTHPTSMDHAGSVRKGMVPSA